VVDPRLGHNANLGQMAVGLARQGEERRGEERRERWVGCIHGLGRMQDKNRKIGFRIFGN
jgi:hypothetical protein